MKYSLGISNFLEEISSLSYLLLSSDLPQISGCIYKPKVWHKVRELHQQTGLKNESLSIEASTQAGAEGMEGRAQR